MRLSPLPARTPARTPGHAHEHTPEAAARRPAVFIDKDGTLIEDVPYNVDPALLRFAPHAAQALRRLAAAGFMLVVVSNQPGVALGRFGLPALRRLAGALDARLAAAGVRLRGFYACPHAQAPIGACACRKPAPGLLLEAASDLAIDLTRSWMIGDILDDVEAGNRAGCRSVHLDCGNETVWRTGPGRLPTATVPDLAAAADVILQAVASDEPNFPDPPVTSRRARSSVGRAA